MDKINLNDVINKINEINDRISIGSLAILLVGVGDLLKRKYNYTESQVQKLLDAIINPTEQNEEQKENARPANRRQRGNRVINVNRPISALKIVDLNMLLLPKETFSSTFTGKSSISSKIPDHQLSGDGEMIQRDTALINDIERSYDQPSDFDPNNAIGPNPDSAIGSVVRQMMDQKGIGSNEQSNEFIQPPEIDMGDVNAEQDVRMYSHEASNEYAVETEEIDLHQSDLDINEFNHIIQESLQQENLKLSNRNRRQISDLLQVDGGS